MTRAPHALLALAALAAGTLPAPADACENLLRVWAKRQYNVRLVDDGVMTSAQRAVARTAIGLADLNTSGMRVTRGTEVSKRLPANTRSELAFVPDIARYCDEDAAGCVHAWTFAGITYEADIMMDATEDWDTTLEREEVKDFGGGGTNLLAAVMHELAHGIGLAHEPDEMSVTSTFGTYQGYSSANRGDYTVSLGSDGSECLHLLYGKRTDGLPADDLVALGFTYLDEGVASNGERYGVHRPTTVYDAIGDDTSTGTTTPVLGVEMGIHEVYLRAGARYDVEYTIENSGGTTRDVEARLVLSTNDTITTADPILWQGTVRVGRFQARTSSVNVRIPWSLGLGDRAFLGLIVDPDGAVRETRTDNNATVLREVLGGRPMSLSDALTAEAVQVAPLRDPWLLP